ncbi:hypothetical protein BGX26_005503 [Mortierella sp. AD094]|nr:hypothetical protein BGX26_005503 [Mortierella sp. AD094]
MLLTIDRRIDHLDFIERTTSRPNCPIQDDVDACVHYGANMANIVELCGPIAPPVGGCQDRVYGLILTTKEFMKEVSEYTQTMVVQGVDIGGELDDFVQTRSHWIIDVMGGRGYELLTSFADDKRLGLHKVLDRLQHRCDNFFNGAFHPFGFGTNWHNLGLGLAHSLYYNMTLYPRDEYKNFISMTTCTEEDLERSFGAHPPEMNFTRWNISTINFKSTGEDEGDLWSRRMIIRSEYQDKGHFWWRSMLTYYAIRPNFGLRELIRQSSTVTTPCMSIHVRHSDKGSESALIDFSKYMEHAEEYRANTGVSNVYLLTDDDEVIKSIKDYNNFQFHFLDVARSNKGWKADRDAGVSKDQQEKTFLIDIFSAVQCQHSIVTYSSNVGRLIAEVAYATQDREPDVVSLDEVWKMDP